MVLHKTDKFAIDFNDLKLIDLRKVSVKIILLIILVPAPDLLHIGTDGLGLQYVDQVIVVRCCRTNDILHSQSSHWFPGFLLSLICSLSFYCTKAPHHRQERRIETVSGTISTLSE